MRLAVAVALILSTLSLALVTWQVMLSRSGEDEHSFERRKVEQFVQGVEAREFDDFRRDVDALQKEQSWRRR